MGTYDTLRDSGKDVQVKCFGKQLRTLAVGDTVVLHVAIDDEKTLDLYIERLRKDEAAGCPSWQSPAWAIINDGQPSALGTYQVAVSDGTYITVENSVISAIGDARREGYKIVDGWGRDETSDRFKAAWKEN